MKKMKNKIVYGQCYKKDDHVYMILTGPFLGYHEVKNTLTQARELWDANDILKLRRAFDNWG
jgi:hypothetical protein